MFNFNKEEKVMSEEDKKMVQELKDAIRRHEQEAEDAFEDDFEDYEEDEFTVIDDEIEETDELSPAGELAYNIADHLAASTANRFAEMIEEMETEYVRGIVRKLRESDAEAVVGMIQVIFLSRGMVHEAEDLELLKECKEYERAIYWRFCEELFDQEVFEWIIIEDLMESVCKEGCPAVIRIPVEVS